MGTPTSSAFDALQSHFKAGLPSLRPSLVQQDDNGDDGSDNRENRENRDLHRTRLLNLNQPQGGIRSRVVDATAPTGFGSRAAHNQEAHHMGTSHPPIYPDPLIPTHNGNRNQEFIHQTTRFTGDHSFGRAPTARTNLISILPKPPPIDDPRRIFPLAARSDQMDLTPKRKADEGLIDPRLYKTSRQDGGPSEPAVSFAEHTIRARNLMPALDTGAGHNLLDSATDTLLERQLNLQYGSDEESESENRYKGESRYNDEDDGEMGQSRRDRGRGRGGGRGRGAKRGPRKAAEPTGDVKYRLNMASNAYVDGRLEEAIEWVEDAIRINAETYRAWTLLASFLGEKGDLKGSFTARVFSCHLQPKHVDGWLHCAEIGIALRDELPDDAAEFLEQAAICYSAALRADINNQQARHGRAAIAIQRGQIRTAAKDYLYLLEHGGEYDVHALRSYAEMTIFVASTGKPDVYTPSSAVNWYRRAFSHFRANGIDDRYPIEWQDINIFCSVLAYMEHTKDALYELKSLARWLLGRSDEDFWDDWQDDDREWDFDNARRMEIEGFQEDRYPALSYGDSLPLDLRTKLAVYRLKLGDTDEAQVSQRVSTRSFRCLTSISFTSNILIPKGPMGHRYCQMSHT